MKNVVNRALAAKKKKLITLLIALIASSNVLHATVTWSGASEEWVNGNGTPESPYLIEKPEHLVYLSSMVASGNTYTGIYFKQVEDFDLNGDMYSFPPIGKSASQPFGGNYDGALHAISNFKPSAHNASCALFAWAKGATIQNVNVLSIAFISTSTTPNGGGVIYNYEYDKVAAIVGYMENGQILNCTNNANADAHRTKIIGGIVAEAHSSVITGCINNGVIRKQNVWDTSVYDGEIVDSYWGGIVGYASSPMTVSNCSNTSGLSEGKYVGGIIGYMSNSAEVSVISGCENSGNCRSWSKMVGGIVGYSGCNTQINNCRNIGKLEMSLAVLTPTDNSIILQSVGGICGAQYGEMHIIGSYNSAEISYYMPAPSNFYIGGLIGESNGDLTEIRNSWNEGNIEVHAVNGSWPNKQTSYYDNIHIGGIIGYAKDITTIEGVFNKGEISCDVKNKETSNYLGMGNYTYLYMCPYVGGIIGRNSGDMTLLKKCRNTGDLTITSSGTNSNSYSQPDKVNVYLGGLVGDDTYYGSVCTLSHTYSVADISAPTTNVTECYVAGLIGKAANSAIHNSYYAGQLQGKTIMGIANGTLNAPYDIYYLSTCGASSGHGEAKTKDEMKDVNFPAILNGTGEQVFYLDKQLVNQGYPIFDLQASFEIFWLNENGSELDHNLWTYGSIPTYTGDTPTKPADAQYTYTFAGWTPEIVATTKDATYTATYTSTKRKYTIAFLNYDGTELQSDEVEYGVVPEYTGATPTKPADAQYTYTFAEWDTEIVAVTGEATYTATFAATPIQKEITVHDGEYIDLCTLGFTSVQKVIVEVGGQVIVNPTCIHIDSLIIQTDGTHSGQIHHGGAGINADHVFLEYILNPCGLTASPDRWYAFSVPFEVDINGGITRTCDNKTLVSGTDFLVMEYNGLLRAALGKGWSKKLTGTLEPGHFYMIGIEGTCNNWRFEKTGISFEGASSNLPLSAYGVGEYDIQNVGWNGLGNTLLHYSSLTIQGLSGLQFMVLYNNCFGKWETRLISEINLNVGQPFFIQTELDALFGFQYSAPNLMPALRTPKAATPIMHFTLTNESGEVGTDHLYLTFHDDATDTYTIGRDVARMSADCKTAAQLWCLSGEGTQLTAHGIADPQTETIIPLGLFVPTTGEYQLKMASQTMGKYQVALLYQGTYVGTLDEGQVLTINLSMGNNSDYSLRIGRKMPTDIDNIQSDKVQSTKELINGRLFILRGEHIYDAQGKKVK